MIDFKNIQIEGFGSIIKTLDFKLNRRNLSIIRGRVGSGKTSIPSAMVWCIYGSTLKAKSSVETWEELRFEGYKGTKVELSLDAKGNKYTFIRCMNYKGKIHKIRGGNQIFILKNGELIHTERNKFDKQKFILDIIGYSHSLFMNSIVFGQRMKKIVEESGPIKKKIFEEAFEIAFIEQAKLATKEKLDKSDSLIGKYSVKLEDKVDRLEDLKEDLEDAKEDETEFKKRKKDRLSKLNVLLKENDTKVITIQNNIDGIKDYDVKVLKNEKDKLDKELNKANNIGKKYTKLLDKIREVEDEETLLNAEAGKDITECETCGSKLSFKKSKKLTQNRNNRLILLGDKADKLRDKQFNSKRIDTAHIEKKINKNTKLIYKAKGNKQLLSNYKENLTDSVNRGLSISGEIKEVRDEKLIIRSKKLSTKISKMLKQIAKINKKVDTIREKRSTQEWLIKDPLSNNGLKAYVFDSLLGKVNRHLAEYSSILGFKVEFGIDLESTRKDFYQTITRDDIIIMYEDLSGGQKQLVDTSVALAIHSVIATIRPINVLFMDEPFEGLDEETIETVAELIDYKCKEQCLYLITHHSSFNPTGAKEILVKLSPEGQTVVL